MVHTRACSRDISQELHSLSPGDKRPVCIPDTRRQSSQLISPCAKLVCATGLLVIVTCMVILIVTHLDQWEVTQEAQYSVLVLGGVTTLGYTASVEQISLGQCPIRESPPIPDLPLPLVDITGGYLSYGAVLVCGRVEQSTTCFVFRSSSDQWEGVGQPMQLRQHSAMGVAKNTAYVIGGSSPSHEEDTGVASCEVYSDTDSTWLPGPAIPVPVHHHCVTSYAGQMYSTGGHPHGRAIFSMDTSLVDMGWRNSSPALHPRYNHGCAVVPLLSGPHLLLSGGHNPDTGICAHTEMVSLSQGAHTAVPGQSGCRTGAVLVEVGGRVLMVGGESSDGDLPTDLLEFDTDTLAWHTATSDKTGRMVQGRHGHVALTIPCTFQANKKPKFHKLLEMP